MPAQARAAEVHALAAAFTQLAFERVAIRAGEREAGFPERGLGGADIFGGFVAGHMITDLRDEPWRLPAGCLAGVTDDAAEVFLVE